MPIVMSLNIKLPNLDNDAERKKNEEKELTEHHYSNEVPVSKMSSY